MEVLYKILGINDKYLYYLFQIILGAFMKGITPVIAIILLLMITIALIGFAFVWFTTIAGQMTNQTSQQLTEQQRKMMTAAKIEIIDIASNKTIFRNSGSISLKPSEIAVYVNDSVYVDCSDDFGSDEIAPGAIFSCTDEKFNTCTNVVITTIGTGDVKSCP